MYMIDHCSYAHTTKTVVCITAKINHIFESTIVSFKNFPVHTSRIQIEFACPHASDGFRIHCSTQGYSAKKCVQSMRHKARDTGAKFALLLLLFYCSVRDWTRICYVIRSKNIRIQPSTRYRIRCRFIFFDSGERI